MICVSCRRYCHSKYPMVIDKTVMGYYCHKCSPQNFIRRRDYNKNRIAKIREDEKKKKGNGENDESKWTSNGWN